MSQGDPTIASLIASAESGDRSAADALFAALYSELHRLAQRELQKRGGAMSLPPNRAELVAKCPVHGRHPYNDPDRRPPSDWVPDDPA